MKILIYTHEYPPFLGGLATTSSKLAFGISNSGHEVSVLAPGYCSDDKNYDSKADFNTIRMSGLTKNHGIPSPIKETAGFFSLKRAISKLNPDLMLLVTREAHAAAGMLSGLPSKIITRVAGYEAIGYLSSKKFINKLIAIPMKKIYLKSSKIISPSESTKELLMEAGIAEKKIQVIYNGVNKDLIYQKKNHEEMILKIKEGLTLDMIYYCPHRPDEKCECRKPKPGMLLQAIKDWEVDIEKSWLIGDSESDVQAGKAVGIKSIRIKENEDLLRQ